MTLQWSALELFGAWRFATSRCSSTSCSFCNPPPALIARSRPAFALATLHGRRPL